jgi:hypothetical protein
MAKRTPILPKKAPQTVDTTKQLVDTIFTVKQLQNFIKEHGSLEKALGAVARVKGLVELTCGFEQLQQALEIVGKEDGPAQE